MSLAIIPRAAAVRARRPTLALAAAEYLGTLRTKPRSTRATYASGLRRLLAWLETGGLDGDQSTEALPETVLELFYRELAERHGSRATLDVYLNAARSFLRFLIRRGYSPLNYDVLRLNLAEAMGRGPSYRTPRIDSGLHTVVLAAEALPLPPDAAARLRLLGDRALLRVLWTSGMRRAEVASLNRSDVLDGQADTLIITGKGQKERTAFLDDPTLAAIGRYLEARADRFEPLFIKHNRGRGTPGPGGERYRLGAQSIWLAVKKYAELAGVPTTTHHFRHRLASSLLGEGARIEEISQILGRSSVATTSRIYARLDAARLREVFDRFSTTPEHAAGRS